MPRPASCRRPLVAEPDGALVQAAAAGDRDAFEELYRRYARTAWGVAQSIVRNVDDASDAVSDAFVNVLRALSRSAASDREIQFRPYLVTATQNAALDIIRRAARVQPAEHVERPNGHGPAEELVAREDLALVSSAFAQLPERWQRALWLLDVEQRSTRDVGSELGVGPNNAAQLAVRARSRLREHYLQAHVPNHIRTVCREVVESLGRYLNGTASSTRRDAIEGHVAECSECADRLEHVRDLPIMLRRALLPLPVLLHRKVWRAISELPRAAVSPPPSLMEAGARMTAIPGGLPLDRAVGLVQQLATASPVFERIIAGASAAALVVGVSAVAVKNETAPPTPDQPPAAAAPAPVGGGLDGPGSGVSVDNVVPASASRTVAEVGTPAAPATAFGARSSPGGGSAPGSGSPLGGAGARLSAVVDSLVPTIGSGGSTAPPLAPRAPVAELPGGALGPAGPAVLVEPALAGAGLAGTNLSGAALSGAALSRANLSGADLSGAALSRADLSGAALRQADLTGAQLPLANLSGADVSGAVLRSTDLSNGVLTSANLSDADLTGAVLTGADLRNADLEGAVLTGANLTGAALEGADLGGTGLEHLATGAGTAVAATAHAAAAGQALPALPAAAGAPLAAPPVSVPLPAGVPAVPVSPPAVPAPLPAVAPAGVPAVPLSPPAVPLGPPTPLPAVAPAGVPAVPLSPPAVPLGPPNPLPVGAPLPAAAGAPLAAPPVPVPAPGLGAGLNGPALPSPVGAPPLRPF